MFWCVVKHMKIRVLSEDIDLHTLSLSKQYTCYYNVFPACGAVVKLHFIVAR